LDKVHVGPRVGVYNVAHIHLIDEQRFTMSVFARLEPFVHTAEKRSFRAAASHLGVTPAAVSKAVAALEAELGVRLLNRTSRHVAVTPEGELYLRHCREALDRLQAGRDLVTHAAQVAEGRIKVSMSFVLGRPVVAALPRLLGRYPRIQPHLAFSDIAVNLVEQEVDVALRTGELADSSLVGRRLRTPRWVTVASPNYLARAGEPRNVSELARHTCLQFARPSGQVAGWRFAHSSGGEAPPFVADRPVLLDHGDLLVDAAAAGLGIAQVFDFMVREPMRRGELVEVMPHVCVAGPPIHALCVPGRQRVPKIRAFVEFAVEVFGAPE
jgi:LysR family transcriptional regulator, regulator for bpeEF and oprC